MVDFEANGFYKEVARCTTKDEVDVEVARYTEKGRCFPTTKEARGIMESECYDEAINGDDYCVWLTGNL